MKRKLLMTCFLLALAVLSGFGGLDLLHDNGPAQVVDEAAIEYLEDIRSRAALAFLAARGINAAISLIGTVEISAVFVSAQPGMALDPIDDMVEQFSDLMLVALASIGIQEVLLKVFRDVAYTGLLPFGLVALALSSWSPMFQSALRKVGVLIVVAALAVRWIIPLSAMAGAWVSEAYLQEDYNQAIAQVESISREAERLTPEVPREEERSAAATIPLYPSRAEDSKSGELLPEREDITSLAGMVQDIPDRLVTLITVFAFETIAWPILMLVLFYGLARVLYGLPILESRARRQDKTESDSQR